MLNVSRNISSVFLCVALLGFAFLSMGGDFFHGQVHDHDHGTEQECPLYQFLVETFIAVVVALAAIHVKVQPHIIHVSQSIIPRIDFSLPFLRGPPSLV